MQTEDHTATENTPLTYDNEEARIQALNELRILDTEPEQSYDDIVKLAAHICGTPISIVNLIARDRTWFKAKVGMEATGSRIEISFCKHALSVDGLMTVQDATEDARFANNPAVVLDPKVRFYAGARLLACDGQPVGTLCVVDYVPRTLTDSQHEALGALARQVMVLLELRRRNFALAELAEAHSKALAQQKVIEERKDEFVSTVSHELRTPLTSIRGALDLINGGMTGPLAPDTKRLAGIALQSTERLVRLINDILDYEKITSGKAELILRPLNLSELAASAVTESVAFGQQFGVALAIQDDIPGTIVVVDSDRITQVFTNLISNAVKASSSGDTVTIKLSAIDSGVRAEVIDVGSGIPIEFQSKIFRRFTQADSGGKRKSGSGLGLNIAKSIVEKHGGSIGFKSVPGEGTVFYFDLPLTFDRTIN